MIAPLGLMLHPGKVGQLFIPGANKEGASMVERGEARNQVMKAVEKAREEGTAIVAQALLHSCPEVSIFVQSSLLSMLTSHE